VRLQRGAEGEATGAWPFDRTNRQPCFQNLEFLLIYAQLCACGGMIWSPPLFGRERVPSASTKRAEQQLSAQVVMLCERCQNIQYHDLPEGRGEGEVPTTQHVTDLISSHGYDFCLAIATFVSIDGHMNPSGQERQPSSVHMSIYLSRIFLVYCTTDLTFSRTSWKS
jgi:hypothetical protein